MRIDRRLPSNAWRPAKSVMAPDQLVLVGDLRGQRHGALAVAVGIVATSIFGTAGHLLEYKICDVAQRTESSNDSCVCECNPSALRMAGKSFARGPSQGGWRVA